MHASHATVDSNDKNLKDRLNHISLIGMGSSTPQSFNQFINTKFQFNYAPETERKR